MKPKGMKCDQLCPWNYYENGCLKPSNEICPMSNIASQKQPQTEADRIRAMSDEELCDFLGQYKFCDICVEGCADCTYHGDCDKRLLDWLKRSVEE